MGRKSHSHEPASGRDSRMATRSWGHTKGPTVLRGPSDWHVCVRGHASHDLIKGVSDEGIARDRWIHRIGVRARNSGQPRLALRCGALVLTVLPSEAEWYGGPVGRRRRLRPRGRPARPSAGRANGTCSRGRRSTAAAGLDVTTRLIEGRAASVIVDTAREIGAELIILGARGHGAIEGALLGSVSAEVVDQAACAVLVARGRLPDAS